MAEIVGVRMEAELIAEIDKRADAKRLTRSDMVREVLHAGLRPRWLRLSVLEYMALAALGAVLALCIFAMVTIVVRLF